MLYDLWLATWESIYHKNDPSNWSNRNSVKIVKQHLGRGKKPIDEPRKENVPNVLDIYTTSLQMENVNFSCWIRDGRQPKDEKKQTNQQP